jgi:hypothetical protein
MAIALCLIGCGTSHGVRDAVQAWAEAVDRAACEREMRCESQTLEWQRFRCYPGVGTIYTNGAAGLAGEGALEFDAEAAADCLAELEALPCHVDRGVDVAASCRDALTPTRGLGDPCTPSRGAGWTGCEGGLFCASTDGCSGTCVEGGAPGDTCEVRPCVGCTLLSLDLGAVCVGLRVGDPCAGSCAPLLCVDGVCEEPPVVGLGESCGLAVASCEEGSQCLEGTCRADGTGSVGEPCNGSGSCTRDLYCDPTRHCAQLLPPGAACEFARACGPDAPNCTRGVCSTEPPPDRDGCLSSLGPWLTTWTCPSGESCDADEVECRPTAAIGATCDRWTNVCTEGARCVDGLCRTIVGHAEDCDDDHVCASTLECVDGRCAPLPELGDPCRDACFGAECVDGTCSARPPGAACDDGVQCESGLCRDGACMPVGAEGAPCGATRGRCARGLGCFGDADDVGRCLPITCGG